MSQKKFKVRRGDFVQVMAGKDKGKRGEILKVLLKEDRVVVKNVNIVTRFAKQSASNPNGVFKKEASIHISNVALLNKETDSPSRVGYRMTDSGLKERYFKNNNASV